MTLYRFCLLWLVGIVAIAQCHPILHPTVAGNLIALLMALGVVGLWWSSRRQRAEQG